MIKAIVLWEPWSTLIALGLKRNETRSWPTRHRGDLAICAAKREPDWRFIEGIEPLSVNGKAVYLLDSRDWFHPGCVICVVDLHGVMPTEIEARAISAQEALFGNYEPGRFAWQTRNLRCLKQPVPVTGRQGLFNLPPEIEAAVRRQLP